MYLYVMLLYYCYYWINDEIKERKKRLSSCRLLTFDRKNKNCINTIIHTHQIAQSRFIKLNILANIFLLLVIFFNIILNIRNTSHLPGISSFKSSVSIYVYIHVYIYIYDIYVHVGYCYILTPFHKIYLTKTTYSACTKITCSTIGT